MKTLELNILEGIEGGGTNPVITGINVACIGVGVLSVAGAFFTFGASLAFGAAVAGGFCVGVGIGNVIIS